MFEIFPMHIKKMFNSISKQIFDNIQEIKMRIDKPILIYKDQEEFGINISGIVKAEHSYIVLREDIDATLKFISGFSMYSLEDELRQGFLTIEGGHRIGVTGKAVVQNQKLRTLKDINGLNIRVAHQIIGCSDKIMPNILQNRKPCNTLIISPPKCGTTTILRDIIRNFSNGFYGQGPFTVGVVDERSEIAGCYKGIPQNDVGIRTDVLDACPKVEGMKMLIRSMSPQVLAVDEIGRQEDLLALEEALGAGVSILCTIHGNDIKDCYKKPILKQMIQDRWFDRIIILGNRPKVGIVKEIINTSELKKNSL
ncbi:stage III sporulation protein AA [Candidatus Epulonipiscium fishelsonii]|uniref:Stage III sporulation protein AA n=1 Tax=Candidatus Epulonipiscium fishelsonii TaxID=77094 RepID=A0ACC8XI54_9FIRM|nr:stage III sporulation protein AA [Epulopiscium sp. SCG-D08WGA-EpuloA1]